MNETISNFIVIAVCWLIAVVVFYVTKFFRKGGAQANSSGIEELERRAGSDNQELADKERRTREAVERAGERNQRAEELVREQAEDNRRAEQNNRSAQELVRRAEEILDS